MAVIQARFGGLFYKYCFEDHSRETHNYRGVPILPNQPYSQRPIQTIQTGKNLELRTGRTHAGISRTRL